MFQGLGLLTSSEFDGAYQAAKDFTAALKKRVRSAGFMETLVLQRICSSFAGGLSTAKKLLDKRLIPDEEEDYLLKDVADIVGEECIHLQRIVDLLGRRPTDPKPGSGHLLSARAGAGSCHGWHHLQPILQIRLRWVAQETHSSPQG